MIVGLGDDRVELGDDRVSYATPPDQLRLQAAVRAWNGRSFTAAQVMPVLDRALEMADRNYFSFYGGGLTLPTGSGLITECRQHRDQLAYLKNVMAQQIASPYVFKHPHKTWLDIKIATINPIMWQSNVEAVTGVLDGARHQLARDLAAGIMNLPGEILAAAVTIVANTLAQGLAPLLPKGFSIPEWLAPTLIVLVGGGIAYKVASDTGLLRKLVK